MSLPAAFDLNAFQQNAFQAGLIDPDVEPVSQAQWRMALYDLSGNEKLHAAPFQRLRINYVLNAPGAIEGEVYVAHPDVTEANFDPAATEVRVFRDDVLVWGGVLWAVGFNITAHTLQFRGEGYFSWLRKRIIWQDLIKYDKDQADLAWELIKWTQDNDGTFGIINDYSPTGVLVDRNYCAADKPRVGESVEELAGMDDSFDWWITPGINDASVKRWKNATPRRGTDLRNFVTVDQTNSMTLDYELDGDTIANRIWGEGAGDCNPPSFEARGNASIAKYGQLHDTADFDDLDHFKSVRAHTRETLRNRKAPYREATVAFADQGAYGGNKGYSWGEFNIGDIVTLASNQGFAAGSRPMRVQEIEVNLEADTIIPFYTMSLNSVVDNGAA